MLNVNSATALLYENFRLFRNQIKETFLDHIDLAAVIHPGKPLDIMQDHFIDSLNIEKSNLFDLFSGVEVNEAQNTLKKPIAKYFQSLISRKISESEIGIVKASSTAFLDAIIGYVSSSCRDHDSLRSFVNINGKEQTKLYGDKIAILAPKGSFKCGALSPMSHSCYFYLIPTYKSNHFKITPQDIEASLTFLKMNGFVIGAFIFEAPTALGQCYSEKEIIEIAAVLDKYPEVLIIQDCYQLQTEHSLISNPILENFIKNPSRVITISSFRRKYGLAAQLMGISAIQTTNIYLLRQIMNRLNYLDRHPIKPLSFSKGQLKLTRSVLEKMIASDFQKNYASVFKGASDSFYKEVNQLNHRINVLLNTNQREYVYALPTQAGQFGFLFVSDDVARLAKIYSGLQFGELLAIKCHILATLLDPMGITNPVGVRFNLVTHEKKEICDPLINKALAKIEELIIDVYTHNLTYSDFEGSIREIYDNKTTEPLDVSK